MSELVDKLLLALTERFVHWTLSRFVGCWKIVVRSHQMNFSLDLVSFSLKIIFPPLSLSLAELKNLPLWWTCHMVQYNRGGGIRGFFSDKIGKRENWKSRRTKLCSKKISKNESLGNSEETAKFALKSSQIGLFTCKEGMALLQNLVLNCLKYNLFFSQLGKGCCVSLDYFNSCTITTTVYYTVYSYSGNTTKNEITTF